MVINFFIDALTHSIHLVFNTSGASKEEWQFIQSKFV